ncbi:MAG: (2Fe-2S)-binding protein [Salinigranum sp.]
MSDSGFKRQVTIDYEINGESRTSTVRTNRTLVEFLREELDLTGTTEGCGVGVCGCCTVHVDGEPINSCQELAVNVDGSSITTIEGLGAGEDIDPVQEAFECEEGFQCGYCTPGMIMMTRSMLDENPDPDDDEVTHYMSENLCRCTGYVSIQKAIDRARRETSPGPADD